MIKDIDLAITKDLKVSIFGDAHTDAQPRSRTDDCLAAVILKLEELFSHSDILIGLGDFLDRPTVTNRTMYTMASYLMRKKEEGKFLYVIIGNHDIYNYNLATLERTTLGVLAKLGLLTIINSLKIGSTLIQTLPLTRELKEVPTGGDILLGHCFYNQPGEILTFSSELTRALSHKYLILGHDHEYYEPVLLGDSLLLRPGSLLRNSAHKYNLEGEIYYISFTFKDSTYKYEGVKTLKKSFKPAKEVFQDDCFVSSPLNKTFESNMQSMLESFSQSYEKDKGSKTLNDALLEVGAPDSVIGYLRDVHERMELSY